MLSLIQLQTIAKTENVIFYKPNCPFCFATRILFDRLVKDKILDSCSVYLLDTDFDNSTFAELMLDYGWKPVTPSSFPAKPQIFVRGEYIAGNSDFYNSKWNKGEGMPNLDQTIQVQNIGFAMSALKAYEEGEKTGNYNKFKSLVGDGFSLFSYPKIGKYTGNEALTQLNNLITQKEQSKNRFEFSNISFTLLENAFVYELETKSLSDRELKENRMIKIIVDNGKVIGFQEFLG